MVQIESKIILSVAYYYNRSFVTKIVDRFEYLIECNVLNHYEEVNNFMYLGAMISKIPIGNII